MFPVTGVPCFIHCVDKYAQIKQVLDWLVTMFLNTTHIPRTPNTFAKFRWLIISGGGTCHYWWCNVFFTASVIQSQVRVRQFLPQPAAGGYLGCLCWWPLPWPCLGSVSVVPQPDSCHTPSQLTVQWHHHHHHSHTTITSWGTVSNVPSSEPWHGYHRSYRHRW